MSEITKAAPPYTSAPEAGQNKRPFSMPAAAWATVLTIAVIVAIYHDTVRSLVSIWNRSETFAHCFIIAPISVWLIWRQRKDLMSIEPRPNPWALVVLAAFGFGWLLASLANVLVFQQYFLVAMIPAAVWAVLGSRLAGAMAFPLAYLLLAVPFGEIFIPALIDFTADFAVGGLQLTGIPVYREANQFTLPSGNWSVVEACSGLRYLIASFTLGTLYAYLTYRTFARRALFVALSLIVPIFANGIRAYLIVMLGHLSGMTLAVGADHLVYGWVFFGLVMLILFWLGSLWRQDEILPSATDPGPTPATRPWQLSKAPVHTALAAIAIAIAWPAYVAYLDRNNSAPQGGSLHVTADTGKWEKSGSPLSSWDPYYAGSPVRFYQTYRDANQAVALYIARYRNQQPGSQLITSANLLVSDSNHEWKNIDEQTRVIDVGDLHLKIRQNRLHSPTTKLLVWRWYRLESRETASPQVAKIILATNKLLGRGDDGAEIIIAARYEDKPEEAVPALRKFLVDMAPAITKGLRDAPAL